MAEMWKGYDNSEAHLRCSGLRPGNVCVNGFRAGAACWPGQWRIDTAPETIVPMCFHEERCADLFEHNGGKPFQRTDLMD